MVHIEKTAFVPRGDPSLFGLLAGAARARPEGAFLRDRFGTELSFAEACAQAERVAGFLRSRGVGRGDRVAILMRNRAELAVAVFAAARIGAVFMVLNPKLRPGGLEKIFAQAEPSALIVDSATTDGLEGIALPSCLVLLNDGEGGADLPDAGRWGEAISAAPVEAPCPGIDLDPVSLVFTSGSTGAPRGVVLSHDNIRFVVAAIQERLRYRESDTVGCFLPLAFDYGLYQIFLAVEARCLLVIGDPAQVGPRLPRVLKEEGVTVLPGVPSIASALITLGRRQALDLPDLRAFTNTGERLPVAYIEGIEALLPGIEVYPMYGLTECKRVSILLPEERRLRPESVGRPLDGTEVFAIDEAGRRLPPGEPGELVVRGRHVALGYWRAPEESAARFPKAAPEAVVELLTGDTGMIDSDGFLYFAARRDDLLKHRGNRISPVEIEIEACAVEGVCEAALLKREIDDTLHLFVTLDRELDSGGLLAALNETLEPAKVPEYVVALTEMPKSLNGKIDRKALATILLTAEREAATAG